MDATLGVISSIFMVSSSSLFGDCYCWCLQILLVGVFPGIAGTVGVVKALACQSATVGGMSVIFPHSL